MSTRPCSRCEKDFFSSEELMALAAEIKVDPSLCAGEEIYLNRLAVCKTCDALRDDVLCCHCGCFIVFRARPAKNYCPHPAQDRWKLAGCIIEGSGHENNF